MPASARPRSARSLSPSLLPPAPHRYLPYHRINSNYTFGEPQRRQQGDMYGCERFGKMTIADNKSNNVGRPQQSYPLVQQQPQQRQRRPVPTHRRAVSLSAMPVPVTQGYILLPAPTSTPIATPKARPVRMSRTPSYQNQLALGPGPSAAPGQGRVSPPRPLTLAPSVPLTPIVESPRPHPQGGSGLMLMTPTIAAFLQRGGSVSVRGADGKAWRVRAPPMVRVQ